MTLVFATHNDHKVLELRQLLPPQIKLYSLTDIGCHEEIPETGNTLEANAKIKADFVKYKYGLDCFADDSGLEIEVLGVLQGFIQPVMQESKKIMKLISIRFGKNLAGNRILRLVLKP